MHIERERSQRERKKAMASILKDMVTGSVAGLIGIMVHVGTARFMWDWTKRTRPDHIKREQEIALSPLG